ncbi:MULTISPECIES: PAS domain-containing methyl-accepting chemotaxis protein [unclassified Methylobacterium]|uniref:methyl-accepting chemotaxis protein n=1 Tax=unclassified Methylobacterium TaxID=2615210 RepID=UPI0006F8EEC4|nr:MULTISPECIES: PAS domain-containing methyl-accepting chemotaxis protein [unclassified Methylobacterium]KQP82614.1 chemotaxis protein [Methylobacterium sp. Leaf117]KQP93008.1 chemotaxis protein [Methylobacterium sp. Leaf113]MCK2053109.1 PAS domain-containing methyl-accepting chemotaxis protein [Methylobacterium sp. 37f]
MLGLRNKASVETDAKLAALDKSHGIIEFNLDGTVITANENFLAVIGYPLAEIRGRHHSLFVAPGERDGAAYAAFWASLRAGTYQAAQYRRIAKGGREVWIEASYNPILDRAGKPYKVVKFATDITRQKMQDADREGQIAALHKAQAVISFSLDGVVLEANPNFLAAVGYSLPEIVGQHHRMFVRPEERDSPAYAAFWASLRAGTYQAAQYRRIAKGGREIWIEASYNPILDAAGRPYKVVKFATDITAQVTLLDDLRRLIAQNFGEIDSAVLLSNTQTRDAETAAGTTADNVQTMAAASEELAASVAEISQSMTHSRAATEAAQGQVAAAAAETRRLTDAASAMTGIVGLIQSIAGQINLLALNATIESARAGEAGRGFAVVAQEVKNLANQAARATEQIAAEIDNVQAVSKEVGDALQTIQGSVAQIGDYVVSTAAAVEEQSVVTQDMSGNMQHAASAVAAISQNIQAIAQSIGDVSRAVGTTKDAARVLAR